MFLYVGGDSFCSDRSSQEHWPVLLADLLRYELKGQGFPGQGWWNTRLDLQSYLAGESADQTPVFVLCHTNINRPLMTMPNGTAEFQEVAKIYHTYMENDDISAWQALHWYTELNHWLKNKIVVHIPCFRHGQRLQSMLDGLRVTTALINFAQASGDHANHFTVEQNHRLAHQLAQIISNQNLLSEISL